MMSWEKGFWKEAGIGGALLGKIKNIGAASRAASEYTAARNAAGHAASQLRKDRVTMKLNPIGGVTKIDPGNIPKPPKPALS